MSGQARRIGERLAALTTDQRLALEATLRKTRVAPLPATVTVAADDGMVSAETTAPVSFAQQRLWLIDRLRPESPAYNMPAAMRLRGMIRHAWIEDGLRRIISRHAVLRTTFRDDDGAPLQVVHDRMPFELGLVDLSVEPAVWREQRAAELARQEANRPFSLSTGPLIRATLIRLAAADHVFLVTMHHIVSDGWSFEILLSELNIIYQALASGKEPLLPPLAQQYADYARSERADMQGEHLQQLLAYWRDRLEGAPQRIALPGDRAAHGAIGNDGALHSFVLSSELVGRLHTVCASEQATPYMAYLTAFLILLYRYSGQADLVVGTAVSHRPSVALETLIGFFVNNLAIRIDFSERPTFRRALQRVRTTVLEALRHQDLPFDCLVQELRPDRLAQENPLFQVMFAFQSRATPRTRADAPASTGSGGAAPAAAAAAKFDLSLLIEAGATDVVGLIEYRTAIFEASTIARMATHFAALLSSGLNDLECPIDRLPWPREVDRAGDGPRDEADGGRGPTLHALVHRQAIATPAKAAVRVGQDVLTYGALDRQASQLAHVLRERRVHAGDIVGLCFDPSFDRFVAMFAVFKAGAAYLPLDPADPVERLRYMVADAGVRVVLANRRVADRLDVAADVVDLDAVRTTIDAQSTETPAGQADEHDLAYIIYTSGSSGRPKGVAVPHTALFNVVSEQRRLLGVAADSLVLQISSFGFDASMFEVAMALGAGACLVLPPDRRDLASVVLEPDEARRLIAVVPPSLIAAVGPETSFNPGTLILAGEAFNSQLATPWLRQGVQVFNAYGPTETTIWTCLDEVTESPGPAPIGRAIRNVRVELLDDWLVRVPIGVPAEICIGGPAVAWGYVGRPDLTAEHFVPDPYSPIPGARLYRTGDRGRRLADGRVEFLGRRDQQVKLRGYRIEIGEVESVVAEHPAVASVAVAATTDLVAYVVCRPTRPSPDEFVEWTARRLPAFMVPSIWVHLDALPLLPSGKVDRARLPAPHRVSPPPSSDDEPTTETERSIAAMCAELLEVDRVGLHDNFFRLGGHSLLAARLLARVAKRFGVSLSLTRFFDSATAASVTEAVLAAGGASPREALLQSVRKIPRDRVRVPVRLLPHLANLQLDSLLADEFVPLSARVPSPSVGDDDERVTVLPASSSQQRLWFLDKLVSGGSFYNIPIALPMRGPVDAVALGRAVDSVVARHEALRTRFEEIDGAAVQVVVDRLPIELPVIDLASNELTARRAGVERLMSEDALAPFDLRGGPLIRAKLLRLSEHEHLFLLTVHHIVCDGWSVAVIAGEIEAFYMRGPTAALPELPVQFGDWALDERLRMQGPPLDTLVSYWRLRLSGISPALPIPTDYARPGMQSYRGRSVQFEIAPQTTTRLMQLASEARATLFMTLLAAFQTFLSRLSGERDIVVGSPVANRGCTDVEQTVGFFVNNVVLRTQVPAGASFRQVLKDVRRRTIEDFDHADLPFDRLVEELQPERLLSRNPLFQVMFVLQNIDQGVQRHPLHHHPGESTAASAQDDRTTTGTAKFDLLLAMRKVDGHLGGAFEYSADLFTAESCIVLSQQFSAWLDAIVAAPDQSIDDISAVSGDERRRLLEWGDGGLSPARTVCVHQLLATQAAEHPESPAIRTGDEVVSYGDVQARVRRLAGVLVRRGIREADAIGICMERSVDLVVAMAAVATVGAHYVLVEPSQPPGLTALVLRQAGAVMLIVHALSRTRATEFDVVVDVDGDALVDEPDMEPPSLGTPDSLLWRSVDITTPDAPRMVAVSHETLLAGVLEGSATAFAVCRRTGQAAALTSYLFAVEVWGTLLRGGELVLLDADPAAAPERFARELRARQIGLLFLAPSMAKATLDQVPGAFSDLTTLVLAGEPVSTATLESIYSLKPPQRVVCGFGGIEYGGFVALGEVGAEECRRTWIAVGTPVAGVRCRVVDGYGRLASVGVRGRLCVEGSRLERIRSLEVSPAEASAGGYHARWRSDGRLELLGRGDRSVWLSGARVNLDDIEAALTAHPGVRRAAVRVWTFSSGDQRPIAYVVSGGASTPTTSELRRFLRLRLPAFMVPVTYIDVAEIPTAASGDTDFGWLPPPDTDRPDLGEPYVAPSTAVQRVLFRIWSEMFGVERIGIRDNFFQLGGHSLLAARVMSRAADAFQVEVGSPGTELEFAL